MKTKIYLVIILISTTAFCQERWIKLNGPEGGAIMGLLNKGDTLIAGAWRSLIYYSVDKGTTWKESTNEIYGGAAGLIASNDNAIFAAGSAGIYKTYDLEDWIKLMPQGEFMSMGKDSKGNIYAGTSDGKIFCSTDNGFTWTVNTFQNWIENFTSVFDYIFAGGYNQIYRKHVDSSWIIIRTLPQGTYRVLNYENNLFTHNSGQVFFSTDLGENWEKRDSNLFFSGNYIKNIIYNKRLIASGNDETGWFGDGWGAAVSDDKGWTWRWSQTGLPPLISGGKIIKSGTDTYMGTNAAGVFKSTDFGDSWFAVNNGLTAARVTDLIIDEEGVMYTSSWSNGFSKSNDLGKTWKMINNGLTNVYCYSIVSDKNGILLGGTDQGTFRSTNSGENWVKISGPTFIYHFRKDIKNRIYALTYGNGLYRTTDSGISWERLDKNFVNGVIYAFAEDEHNHYYTGGRGGAIYKTTNDGTDWVKVYQGIPEAVILDLVITPEGNIFASSLREGVIRSTDHGQSWELKSSGLNTKWIRSLTLNSGGDLILGGYSEGIWKSTDKGENWIDITSNINLTTVRKFLLYKDDLFLATDESVWKSNPDSLTSITHDGSNPTNYSLSQNYPNPFNPTTTIKYSLPEEGRIEIIIYDILGREVSRLIDEEKPAGEYTVNFNASDLSSGLYICKMKAGEYTSSKKMVYIK